MALHCKSKKEGAERKREASSRAKVLVYRKANAHHASRHCEAATGQPESVEPEARYHVKLADHKAQKPDFEVLFQVTLTCA